MVPVCCVLGYAFLYLISRVSRIDAVLWSAVPLLAIHIVMWSLIRLFRPDLYNVDFFRSFLLYAIPFMLLGYYVAKHRQDLSRYSTRHLVTMAVVGCGLQFVEYSVTRQSLDFYFGTVLYSSALFLLALRHPEVSCSGAYSLLRRIGQDLSMWIYLFHSLCIEAVPYYCGPLMPDALFLWLYPLIAIASSIAVAGTLVALTRLPKRWAEASKTLRR